MSGTANLNAPFIVASQNQKEVTANAAFTRFDAALTETLAVNVSSGNATPTAEEVRAAYRILITGATTAGRTITMPSMKKPIDVSLASNSTQTVSIVRGTASFTLYPGCTTRVITDGTTNGMVRLGEHGPEVNRIWIRGAPSASEVVARWQVQETSVVLPNLLGWDAQADTAADSTTVFNVRKNGSNVGTLTWAAAGTVPTLATSSGVPVTYAAGDYFDVQAPSSPDLTLSDIFLHILLIRS